MSKILDWSGRSKYMTEEKVVGKWIDGKNIYQKSCRLNSAVTVKTSWTDVLKKSDYGLTAVDKIIYGFVSRITGDSGSSCLTQLGFTPVNSQDPNGPYIRLLATGKDWPMQAGTIITLQYTKTTD